MNRAGQAAREVAGALTSDPAFRELAATMINEQLGPSVSEVFGIGGDDLKQILTDVRVELDKQGLELLVLIEDFSIFQGIQGGLIDAITLISTETQKLCPMRVVMAVTTGYFVNQMPETVYTRTYRVFDLDLPDGVEASFNPAGFAGSLPQCRARRSRGTGRGPRTRRRTRRTPASSARSTPRAMPAFGEVDGYGLFPFNAAALDRAIRSQSTDGSFRRSRCARPGCFGRSCIAIRPRSTHGRFPSEGFATEFRTGADDRLANIEDQVKLQTPGDEELTERRVRLVRFWGSGTGAENLAPTIHAAFDIAPVDGLDVGDTRAPSTGTRPCSGTRARARAADSAAVPRS